MIFYFSIFVLFTVLSILEIYLFKRKDSYYIYFQLVLMLFFLAALKARGLGMDSANYEGYFETITHIGDDRGFEFLYARLNQFVKFVLNWNNYTGVLIIEAFLIYSIQNDIIQQWSIYPCTSLLYLWAINCCNIFFVRQTVAMLILVHSVRYIIDNKLIKFLLTIVVATLFHRSSVIFIFAWLVWKLNFRRQSYILILIVTTFLFPNMLKTIGLFALRKVLHNAVLIEKATYYLETSFDFYSQSKQLFILVKGFLNQAFLLIFLLIYFNKIEKNQICFKGLFNLCWFGSVIYCSTIQIHIQLARFALPYQFFFMILYSSIGHQLFRKRGSGFLYFLLFTLYLFMRFYIYIKDNASVIIPYRFI